MASKTERPEEIEMPNLTTETKVGDRVATTYGQGRQIAGVVTDTDGDGRWLVKLDVGGEYAFTSGDLYRLDEFGNFAGNVY